MFDGLNYYYGNSECKSLYITIRCPSSKRSLEPSLGWSSLGRMGVMTVAHGRAERVAARVRAEQAWMRGAMKEAV